VTVLEDEAIGLVFGIISTVNASLVFNRATSLQQKEVRISTSKSASLR